jgi:hypothetical protein
MLNEPDFEFFRYCEGSWKLTRWATKAYPSWVYNHYKPSGEGDNKTLRAKKRKRNMLDDPSLLQINDNKNDDTAIVPLRHSSPIENDPISLALPAHAPASIPETPVKVGSYQLYIEVSR